MRAFRTFLIIAALYALTGCSLSANIIDISEVELSFDSPAQNTFSNKTAYAFKAKLNSDNKNLTLEKAKLHIFEDGNCDPEKLLETYPVNTENTGAAAQSLKNGKKYSARITIATAEKVFQSVCSPWVGIDTLEPSSVAVSYPNHNGYTTSKEFMAAWTTSTDAGISGLKEKPYLIRLYGQAACGGDILQTTESHDSTHLFKNLSHGIIYSVLVSSLDNAGNESPITCSPYMEIDLYAPGFQLTDSSSIPDYSRTLHPTIRFNNDASATYWCITSDTTYRPYILYRSLPKWSWNLGWLAYHSPNSTSFVQR